MLDRLLKYYILYADMRIRLKNKNLKVKSQKECKDGLKTLKGFIFTFDF